MTLQIASARRGRITRNLLIGLALFLFFGAWAIWRQVLYIRDMPVYRPYLSANIMPGSQSTGMVRTLALGYDDAAAVLLWIRTIQDFGGQFRDPFALRSLSNAFFSMATLSPFFTEMYDFGGLVIGDEGGSEDLWLPRVGQQGAAGSLTEGLASSTEAFEAAEEMRERAMRLFEMGIENDRMHYIHPYNAVYTALSGFHDPQRAIPYAEVAVTRPDAPVWVAGTIPYLMSRSGEYRIALSQWFAQLRAAIQNQDDLGIGIRLRKIAEDGVNPWNTQILTDALHLWIAMHGGEMPQSLELGADQYLVIYPEHLNKAIDAYRVTHGQYPPSLQALAEENLIPPDAEPLLFFDYPRFLNDALQLIESATPFAAIPEERFGLENYLTVTGRIPESPLDLWADYVGDYYLQNSEKNHGPIRYAIDHRARDVKDTQALAEETARDMAGIRSRLDAHREEQGEWPATLDALYADAGQAPIDRGSGEPFVYDAREGVVRSRFFPSSAMVSSPEGFADPSVVGGPRPLPVNPSSE